MNGLSHYLHSHFHFSISVTFDLFLSFGHLSSISLSNVTFVYWFGVLKTGPSMHCEAFKKGHSPFIFCEDGLLRSSEKWECCAMSSLMYPWPEVMVSGLKPTKVSWLAVVQKKAPQPSCLSWMVLILMSRKQKRKRQTGPVSSCPKFVLRGRQLKKGASDEVIYEQPLT